MLLSLTAFASEKEKIDLSEYTNNEVFVMYTDGSFDVLTFDSEDALANGIDELSNDETVSLIQPNYSYESTDDTSDPLYSKQWALENDGTFYMEEQKNEYPVFDTPFGEAKQPGQWQAPDNFGRHGGNFRKFSSNNKSNTVTATDGIDINISDAWDVYEDSGREVIVAIVDTGVDYTHEELADRIWINSDEIPGNGIDDDGNGYVDDVYGWNFYDNTNQVYTGSEDDHGTHGAGTIVAKADNGIGIAGIAQSDNIKVMSVKALGGNDGSGTTASVIKAIQYAEANGASICNLSLGTSNNDKALYMTIANSNMLFVVAAGNDGANTDRQPCYPASYNLDNIISVANISYDGTLSYSSNYGTETVDIAAPGTYILSTTTNNSYSYMSGTSMAAPMVSAAAALVYSHYADITLADVKEILLSTVTKLESLEDSVLSGGMLDLGSALTYDISNLSGETFESDPDASSAPAIEVYQIEIMREMYLILKAYDADGDLSYVSYASGEQTVDYFTQHEGENIISLDANGMAILRGADGVYTFYAVDANGNSSVSTVTLKNQYHPINNFFGSMMRFR